MMMKIDREKCEKFETNKCANSQEKYWWRCSAASDDDGGDDDDNGGGQNDDECDHVWQSWWPWRLSNPSDIANDHENIQNWSGRNTKQIVKQILVNLNLDLQARFLLSRSPTSGDRRGGDGCSVSFAPFFGSWAKILLWAIGGTVNSDLWIRGGCGDYQ